MPKTEKSIDLVSCHLHESEKEAWFPSLYMQYAKTREHQIKTRRNSVVFKLFVARRPVRKYLTRDFMG